MSKSTIMIENDQEIINEIRRLVDNMVENVVEIVEWETNTIPEDQCRIQMDFIDLFVQDRFFPDSNRFSTPTRESAMIDLGAGDETDPPECGKVWATCCYLYLSAVVFIILYATMHVIF